MRLTITNAELKTAARINVPASGIISAAAALECRRRLGTPAGYPNAGPLGEIGEQTPQEAPGFVYRIEELEDGRVRLTPVLSARSPHGRKASGREDRRRRRA